jgi:hypothetical protein
VGTREVWPPETIQRRLRRPEASGNEAGNVVAVAPATLWKDTPDEHDYLAANAYLSLVFAPAVAGRAVEALRAATLEHRMAKDLLRASGLTALSPENRHVANDLKKIKAGRLLSPVLLVRGELTRGYPLIIADGYHRICAAYHLQEDTIVTCHLADLAAAEQASNSESPVPGSGHDRP